MILIEYIFAILLALPVDWAVWGRICFGIVQFKKMGDWYRFRDLYWQDKILIPRVLFLVVCMVSTVAIYRNGLSESAGPVVTVFALGFLWLAISFWSCWRLLTEHRP